MRKAEKNILFRTGVILFLSSFHVFSLYAQKLPSVQNESISIPGNLKIDGNAIEWNNKLAAYNKSTELFYLMANDHDNLYIAIQITEPRIIQKFIKGGITFTANTTGKKTDNNGVIFPLLNNSTTHQILMDAGVISDQSNSSSQIVSVSPDSLKRRANESLKNMAKEFKLVGMKTVNDTIVNSYSDKKKYFASFVLFNQPGKYIPVENQYGLRAAVKFDEKGTLTYELLIPFKLLELTGVQKFGYNIKLNGLMDDHGNIPNGASIREVRVNGVTVDPDADLNSPTNFSGEYTLTK